MSPGDTSKRDPAVHSVGGPIGACPACGGHEFLVVYRDEEGDFCCTSCDRRWHYSMGFVSPVDPPDPSPRNSASARSPRSQHPRSGRV